MSKKCLVHEAMDKCKCEMCGILRKSRDQSVKWVIEQKAKEMVAKAFEEINPELKDDPPSMTG